MKMHPAFLLLPFALGSLTAQTKPADPVSGQAQSADQGSYSLRLDVRQVPVDIVVLDKAGKPVRGLKPGDFTVKEDGKPQHLLSFEWVDGTQTTYTPPKLPALPANTFVDLPTRPERGPLYILYYDMVNTERTDQMVFRRELMKFLDNTPTGARIALFVNATGLHMLQGFTTDHELLRQAALRKGPGPHIPNVFLMGNTFGQHDIGGALSNLTFIAQYMQGLPGRKNLIWMASEFPIPVGASLVSGSSTATAGQAPQMYSVGAQGGPQVLDLSYLEREAVMHTYSALMQSQIALYPLSLRGVVGSESQDEAADAMIDYGNMGVIASATGGRAFQGSNSHSGMIAQAMENGQTYYTVSYSPSNKKYDDSERSIAVALVHPEACKGCKLTYRKLYYALSDEDKQKQQKKDELQARFLDEKKSDTLYANIEHGAPIMHDLVFSAHLAKNGGAQMATPEQMKALEDSPEFFKTRKKHPGKALPPVKLQRYSIDYDVIDPALRSAIRSGSKQTVLEFAAAAYNNDGVLQNSMLNQGVATANATAPAEAHGGKPRDSFHAVQTLDVPPGAAYIRLAVRDMATNRTGTIEVALPLKDAPQVAQK